MTWEDPRNVALALALVSNPASTPSFGASVVGRSALAAPFIGLEGIAECVSDCSMEKKGQHVVYVEWFGHWDQQHLHHQC